MNQNPDMENKEPGDSGAGVRKSGRIRSRVLRLSPGTNDLGTLAGNSNSDDAVIPRKRKSSDKVKDLTGTDQKNSQKENKPVSEEVEKPEEAENVEVTKGQEELQPLNLFPELKLVKVEPAKSPTDPEPKPKKKRGRKSKASLLLESQATPTVEEPKKADKPEKLEKLEKVTPIEIETLPKPSEPETPKEKDPIIVSVTSTASVTPEQQFVATAVEEEELEWSDEPGIALSVIWGEQITNSIKRLTNLKFFCVTKTPVFENINLDNLNINGEQFVEEPPKPATKRRGGSNRRSTGGGGSAKKARSKLAALGTSLHKVYFTNGNGSFGVTSGANFKLDTLFPGESMLGGMEGMELVLNQPEAPEPPKPESEIRTTEDGSQYFEMVEVVDGVMVDNVASYENVLSTEGENGQNILTFSAYKKKKRNSAAAAVAAAGDGSSTVQTSDPVAGKPNNTYTEIIGKALEENPTGLTVSEIYDWISTKYPYYHPNDDRWKNSVRHNLSISPYFHKGDKSTAGAGHIWTLAESCKEARGSTRRKSSYGGGVGTRSSARLDPIDLSNLKTDTDMAVASILGKYRQEVSVPEPEEGYEEVVIPNEVAIGSEDQDQPMNATEIATIDPLEKPEGEVVEVTIHNMAIQPGYTINLDELFARQMGYSMNLGPVTGSGEGSMDSDKENQTSGTAEVQVDYAMMALDQSAGVPCGPRAEPVLDYGVVLGRQPEHLEREGELRTLSDMGQGGEISVAELGFHSPIGSGDEDQLIMNEAVTQPFEQKADYAMSALYDESGLPIIFN